jgi:hypothetical protein
VACTAAGAGWLAGPQGASGLEKRKKENGLLLGCQECWDESEEGKG